MTATTTRDDVVAATRPWALYALGQHVADHELAFEQVDVRDQVTVWVTATQATRWRLLGVTEADHTVTRHVAIADAWKHEATLVLHGSCVQVQLRWFTYVDHAICDLYDECMTALCACRDVATCEGYVTHACSHGMNLCPDHAAEQCDECRQGRA